MTTWAAEPAPPTPLHPAPPTRFAQSLLELVASEVTRDALGESEALQAFYSNTLAHIAHQKRKGGEVAARYDGLQV